MKNYRSILAITFIGIVYAISVYWYEPYNELHMSQGGDTVGYYMYLPSFFLYHDLSTLDKTYTAKYKYCAPNKIADVKSFNKYFMGSAILQAPFFFAGHILAGCLGEKQDGFSMPYMYAIQLSCDFYTLLAFFIIMLVLRRSFSDAVVGIVLLIIGLGTNLYYLVVYQSPLSHPYLFFWYSLLIFCTVRFYETYKSGYILLMGFICGMIMLTRFSEPYAIVIPLFWGIRSLKEFWDRIKLLRKFALPIVAAAWIMAFCLLPQCLYWKISTGQYLYYSYHGEKFDFLHPNIWLGFFDGSNGWLIYSPIMVLALIGIVIAARRLDGAFMSLIIFLPIHCYIIYSWWCWFYMGSYGSRPMTEAYPLLSIPLAYTVDWFWTSLTKKVILIGISACCIFEVMFQTYQTHIGIFISDFSNWHYNFVSFGKVKLTYEESVVQNTNEFQPHDPKWVKTLYENQFEDPSIPGRDTTVASSGKSCVRLSHGEFSTGYDTTIGSTGIKAGQWIKASINCLTKQNTNSPWNISSLAVTFIRNGKTIKWNQVGLQNRIDNPDHRIWHFSINKWGKVYFYAKVPDDISPTDTIMVFVCHEKSGPDIYLDDLKVELYDNK